MKKKVEYYIYICDRCNKEVSRLYGNEYGKYPVPLQNISQSRVDLPIDESIHELVNEWEDPYDQEEECRITPEYYLRQTPHSGKSADFKTSGVCLNCLHYIVDKALKRIEAALNVVEEQDEGETEAFNIPDEKWCYGEYDPRGFKD